MNVQQLSSSLDEKLNELNEQFDGLSLRQKVLQLVQILQNTRSLSVAVLKTEGIGTKAARERMRIYFVKHVGVTLDAIELEVVSGISDYGRRIRELRVQDGYKIITGAINDPENGLVLRPNQYLLLRAEPDKLAAHRWHVANRIRNEPGTGSQERILKFFQANVGEIVTTEELIYVGRASEAPRRARELRTEQGYAVATRFTGRPDLKPGEYVLESLDRVAEPNERRIPLSVATDVFNRDENQCRLCGWSRDKWTHADPRFLEIHHFVHHSRGGENTAANLLVLCNRCHDDIHAGRKQPPEP